MVGKVQSHCHYLVAGKVQYVCHFLVVGKVQYVSLSFPCGRKGTARLTVITLWQERYSMSHCHFLVVGKVSPIVTLW